MLIELIQIDSHSLLVVSIIFNEPLSVPGLSVPVIALSAHLPVRIFPPPGS